MARIKNSSSKNLSFKEVKCSKCGSPMKISHDAIAGICWRCTLSLGTK